VKKFFFDETLQPYVFAGDFSVGARGFDPIADGGASLGELVVVAVEATVTTGSAVPAVTTPANWVSLGSTSTLFPAGYPLAGTPIYYKGAMFYHRSYSDDGTLNFLAAGGLAYRLKCLRFSGGGVGSQSSIGLPDVLIGDYAADQERSVSDAYFGAGARYFLGIGFASGRQASDGAFLDGDGFLDPVADGYIGASLLYKIFDDVAPTVRAGEYAVGGVNDYNVLMSALIGPGG
jgi:hypothetical protein